jgi:flagellin
MSLGVLTNISAIYAENNLNQTQASLQNTLTQLSSGSRINSGSDDAAGLAVVDGLQANEAALTQSSQNATDGVGLLQTADGALSQVNDLLNRAVTLATEAANGTLDTAQVSSANAEYQNIITEIGDIGSTTNFNGNSVFSNSATSLFVSDGTSSGTNNYNVEVGSLTASSIGQTQNTTVTSAAIAPTVVAPLTAVPNTAGVYTLGAASGDTLSGSFVFSVGTTGTPTTIAVASGTSQTTLENTLNANSAFTAAGLSATLVGGKLTITGPTSGANAAANTVNFGGTNLIDSGSTTATPAAVTSASTGTAAINTATLTASGTLTGTDVITGSLSATFGGQTYTYTATTGETLAAFNTGLAAAFAGSGLTATQTLTAGAAGTDVYSFTGTHGGGGISVVSTIGDTTAGTISPTYANPTPYVAPTAATATISLGSSSNVLSGNINVSNGTNTVTVATQGATGAAAASLVQNNTALQALGISASFNATTNVLTFTGISTGAAGVTVTPAVGTLYTDPILTTVATTTAAAGSSVTGATTSIVLGSANDTVGGTLALTIGNTGLAKDSLSLTIAPGTSGNDLVNQINSNTAFQAAGVTAAYNSTNSTVTLTGPVGTANTISTTGTSLTDTSSAYASAGANLTASGVSSLTQSNAPTILTTLTDAIADVAYQRGILGADVNQLTAVSNVASAESENLTSASSALDSTDYGQATSDLAKYQVLSQTGIAALSQANSVQQEILKLLQ